MEWHAASHLGLDAHTGPLAATLSFIGFVVVLVAMSLSRRRRRDRVETPQGRRAA